MAEAIEKIIEAIITLYNFFKMIWERLLGVKKEKIKATKEIIKEELQVKKELAETDETFSIPPEDLEEEPKKLVSELRKEFRKW